MDLEPIPWRTTRYPGVAIHFYASDKQSGRVLALIRMEPGCGYPEHRHRGEEHVLVLQGGYRDERRPRGRPRSCVYEDRSVHASRSRCPATKPACCWRWRTRASRLLGA
jgi:anti-sigma factor ChrR (cupin superfamily)